MDLPTALVHDLVHLGNSIGLAHDALHAPLIALVTDLWAATPSYRGLYLTIVENDYPVNLAAFPSNDAGEPIATSLRIPFAALGPGFDTESRVVFYAATPGAFVDLAADLGHALKTSTSIPGQPLCPARSSEDDGQNERQYGPPGDDPRPIALDIDLPPPTLVSGLTGVDELATINRAVGMLIDQGHHPDQARAVLRRHAAGAGVEPHIFAARLLRR